MNFDLTKKEASISGTGAKRAIILLGHGSRAASAADDMEKIAFRLKEKLAYEIIETCQMSGRGARFPEVFERCIGKGATVVLVLPYFLHKGIHLLQDIPEIMREKAAAFPAVKIVLGQNLGFDECLVDLVMKRLEESWNLPDIRKLEEVSAERG